jgi:hypothetical protein
MTLCHWGIYRYHSIKCLSSERAALELQKSMSGDLRVHSPLHVGAIKCFMYYRQIALVREVTALERVRKAKFHNANCCFP